MPEVPSDWRLCSAMAQDTGAALMNWSRVPIMVKIFMKETRWLKMAHG